MKTEKKIHCYVSIKHFNLSALLLTVILPLAFIEMCAFWGCLVVVFFVVVIAAVILLSVQDKSLFSW